jgi:hypothetical protein
MKKRLTKKANRKVGRRRKKRTPKSSLKSLALPAGSSTRMASSLRNKTKETPNRSTKLVTLRTKLKPTKGVYQGILTPVATRTNWQTLGNTWVTESSTLLNWRRLVKTNRALERQGKEYTLVTKKEKCSKIRQQNLVRVTVASILKATKAIQVTPAPAQRETQILLVIQRQVNNQRQVLHRHRVHTNSWLVRQKI